MNADFLDMFNVRMMRVGAEAKNTEEAIRFVGGMMAAEGYVEELYWQDVYAREQKFPTGLPTQPVAIAIPHADPDKVLKGGIAVAVFKQPVKFRVMGSNDPDEIDVPVIFMLALKDFKNQPVMIRDLLTLIQSKAILKTIYEADSADAIMAAVKSVG
ncbi:MAG: PTS sugar transporter subunit IIA [Anaerolineae bacterium]|jgi:PTS system galactitol-specific IIA component|nr:PTS sugar transporter subunit IIA [Anaerolineae bacterium]